MAGLLKWLIPSGKSDTKSNQQRKIVKKAFHRGYYIENSSGNVDGWIARVNGEFITGKLELIKKSIDWWCDLKKVFPPESFANIEPSKKIQREVIVHQGLKIMNDTGEHNEWYMYHNGQLLKGTKLAIVEKIDQAIKKSTNKGSPSK